jgi:endonuclease G
MIKIRRHLAQVFVVSGPLFLPTRGDDGRLWVKYEVIGPNHVAVPTHFFKVVLTVTARSSKCGFESYLMPNAFISDDDHISNYQVPLDVVEKASGYLFFEGLEVPGRGGDRALSLVPARQSKL